MRQLTNFVRGKATEAKSGRRAELVDPATEEVFATAPVSGPEDVDEAMEAARTAFESWSAATPAQRQLALFRLAEDIESNAEDIVRLEAENTGKPHAVTRAEEIPMMLEQLRFFAGAARLLEGKAAAEYLPGHTSYVRREPIGVCAQVTPWNYPLLMAIWKIAPAIAAGNTVVLKPSDTTPATTVLLAELAAEHLPAGVLNVLCGDRDTGRALVEHPVPALVSITGSVRAGMEVAGAAAADLKRTHLELGGKAPAIVFNDANLENAAAGIAEAGFFNAGQDCTAATRVLVQSERYEEFLGALVEQANQTRTGMPNEADVLYGPLNNAEHFAKVSRFVELLPEHARIHTGGERFGERGYFYAPTVISGVGQHDEIVQREVFGPVLTVQRFTEESEALHAANDIAYGLASSVWTSDHGTAMRVSARLEFGTVWINTHIPLIGEMPHGGFKHSGYGKDLSTYGLEDYTRVKHVMSNIDG